MNRTLRAWSSLGRHLRNWNVELRLGLRVSIAAVLSFAVSHWLNLPLALWTVLTAVLLTQLNVGRSLKATNDYLVGTLGGAVYSGTVAVLIPHHNELALLAVLAILIAPLAMLAAINPRFNTAPFTAVLVLLAPTIADVSQLQSAVYRVVEVTLGAIIGLAVSLLVFPARAQLLTVQAAARMLDLIAGLLLELFKGFRDGLNVTEVRRIQDSLALAFAKLDAVATEAERERMTNVVAAHPRLLTRTLLRLRHDLIIIGRAAAAPLPETIRMRLVTPLEPTFQAAADFLRASGGALLSQGDTPPLRTFEAAVDCYLKQIAEVRRLELTHDLPVDSVERIFALSFALEQLRANLGDLARVVEEYARSSRSTFRRRTIAGRHLKP
jgi:uncharacterized membrane protein YccC